ncbi:tyrosine-protein phosphatase non-receptor type 23 [Diorhabda sublineata]|uniref:tyrosine-protein phosphatase non-receptor type 23 n=1 Tax=Diorhabda sublineata TaxID=1163346 RepID=UPI0024E05E29|nr:tyrosine-protein phosphatase non-receptor type 23 [Diorhabda sublineata]
MEAAPKLPMLSFDLLHCTDNVHFGSQLKKYIATFYGEDPDSYTTEINNLDSLRAAAVRPSMDVNGVQLLKKYYCQLHFLKSRFPMEEHQDASVNVSWKNNQLDLNYSSSDIQFELMVIMYNIGALHSFLGSSDSRNNPDGMKMSCTHFQCAAWAFQTVKEKHYQYIVYLSLVELIHFFQQVSLAQAQECILEKSMFDNRKPTIIAKVAVQVHGYYKQSLRILESVSEDNFRDKSYKEWIKYLQFKLAYYKCISLLFQGQQAEEQQKMGERVAFYQAASEQLEEAKKWAATYKNQTHQQEINEGLAFTQDVVEGKRKAAKNENEYIYHEAVPDKDQLQEVKGASLVKGIPFSINDTEVSGPDIFSRLVPMEAHEAASLYSEKKAQMLRQIGELIETKDQSLAEFMSSMQLDLLTKMHQATGIPQDLIDRAAALSARPNAIQDLISSMGKLSNIYQEVEANLNEIDALLKSEEEAEKGYQEQIGKRPPSILATDLTREAAKYREAHTKASDSNQTLHRAMTAHVANLKILQQPLKQLQLQLPFVELPNPNIDEKSLKDLETLVARVEEMRNQRAMLWAQLRESVHKDDITSSLVTKSPNQSLEQLFQLELQKHQQLIYLIEQNAAAQENIKKALVDAYAQAVTTRKYIQDILQKRSITITSLIASYDSYEDLLSKANKGIEFYTKLEMNVSKLLQRIKSTCKVQQEERDQLLSTSEAPKWENPATSTAPKLKDYLDSRKNIYPNQNVQYPQPAVNYSTNMELPPGIRPNPVGSEVTDLPTAKNSNEDSVKKLQNYPQYSYSNYIPQPYTPTAYEPTTQTYNSIQSNINTQYDCSKAYTTTTNSYPSAQSSSSSGFIQQQQPVAPNNTTNYQYQNIPVTVGDRNVYYPQGYSPNTNLPNSSNVQLVSGQVKYHNVEYASSVQPNQTPINTGSIYSSPLTDMSSINTTIPSDPNFMTGSYGLYYNSNPLGGTNPVKSNQYMNQANPTAGYSTDSAYYSGIPYAASQATMGQFYQNGSNMQLYAQVDQNKPTASPSLSAQYNTNQNYNQYYPTGNTVPLPQQATTGTSLPNQGQTVNTQPTINYVYGSYYPITTQPNYNYNVSTQQQQQPVAVTKSSNIDLLSGLDFNISQAPLVPLQNVVLKPQEVEQETKSAPTPTTQPTVVSQTQKPSPEVKRPNVKILPSKPLNNKDVKNLFNNELEKYEKFVETLTHKTLSGPTTLDIKWKEIQDQQDSDLQKKIISVARCYPMKNRYPDILPYDYSRVELCDSKDDYINASFIKDVSPYMPPFIVTQVPLAGTVGDLWTMVREQQVELILCLLSDNEIGDDVYWPKEKGQSINVINMVITLQSVIVKSHWIERLICVNLPEKRESRVVLHLQFTSWPGSLFPTNPDAFISYILESINLYQQQKCNTHPVVVHCSSGIGRSGLLCLLTAAIFDVTNNANSIPDLTALGIKLSNYRKNILRDREHLKFGYECFLAYIKYVVSEDMLRKKLNELEPKKQEEPVIVKTEKNVDPLSTLDPFWANKK